MLNYLNDEIFLLVNAPRQPGFPVVVFAEMAAEWTIFVAMALVAALWVWGTPERRGRLLATVGGVSTAVGINQILGMLWYEPRPFAIGIGHSLIHHAADNSFPSDHATFIWSLGFSLVLTAAAKRWGVAVWLSGLAVAWARVYLGVHFPIDMVASLLVACLGAIVSFYLVPVAERLAVPLVEPVYVAALERMRLPPGLFPRETLALPHPGPDQRR